METTDLTNESNLPEKGAEGAENTPIKNTNEESTAQNEVTNDENLEVPVDLNEVVTEKSKEDAQPAPEIETKAKLEPETEASADNQENIIVEESASGDKKEETTESNKEATSENKEQKELPEEDYSSLSKKEMITKLNELVRHYSINQIKDRVEGIKVNFYKKHKAEVAEARKAFEDGGGNPDEFKPASDFSEDTFKELYNQFRKKKHEQSQVLEEVKKENLKKKYQIIDEIKELINNEESINKTFQDFRELQNRWRDAGLVPQNDLKNLWETYNHTVESFYDFIKINKELRDLDLKKNLEEKLTLCEKAEGLLLEDSVTKAFKTLQEYHNKWREIGPVPREQKDDIWERFKAATSQINRKHQEYFEGLKDLQVENLEQKTKLCEKVEEILEAEMSKPKDWEDKANEVIEIQKLWRTIGFAPKKDNNKIYQRFKTACDSFFSMKREYYKGTKEIQKNNLQLKLDLCVQAEALKDSTEWKKTTEDFIKLQKRWKEIGPVPKKHSESVWKRFRTACDSFFNTKSEFFSTIDSRQEDNLKLKIELIEKINKFEKLDDDKESLTVLMAFQKEWSDIGHVPLNKKDELSKNFRDAIDAQFNKLKIENNELNRINFKTKVDGWVSSNSRGKLYSERNKVVNKIRELENEISLYENNIGFFSKSSNSSSMIDDINRKIEKAKERMVVLKEKLKTIDKADTE